MPARYTIDRDRRLVLSIATGTLTNDDLRRHMGDLTVDPDFDPGFRQIFDFRAVEELEATGSVLRDIRAASPWKEPTRRAFVCTLDVVFGMARMFQMLSDGGPDEIRVFRRMPDALEWLEIEAID